MCLLKSIQVKIGTCKVVVLWLGTGKALIRVMGQDLQPKAWYDNGGIW
jgi:hypothetical protein